MKTEEIKALADIIHKLSVGKKWHSSGSTNGDMFALIHSDWTDAVYAYWNDEPDETIARCLMNGCLDLLDAAVHLHVKFTAEPDWHYVEPYLHGKLTNFVTYLHYLTSDIVDQGGDAGINGDSIYVIVEVVYAWVKAHKLDPDAIMQGLIDDKFAVNN